MTKEEFRKNRIVGRDRLLTDIVSTFKALKPFAIHQFGSGPNGYKDEFSDIDVWITFRDGEIDDILSHLAKTFESIAPVLVKHHSRSWSPVGGSSNSIIHDTEHGLFVVDYYIAKHSESYLKADSKVLFGEDTLKRGEWKLNSHTGQKRKDTHTFKKDLDLLLDLVFISYKGIVRKWDNDGFINTLKLVHKRMMERYIGKLKRRQISLSFKSNARLLSDIYRVGNKRQRRAVRKIRQYAKQIELLY